MVLGLIRASFLLLGIMCRFLHFIIIRLMGFMKINEKSQQASCKRAERSAACNAESARRSPNQSLRFRKCGFGDLGHSTKQVEP